MTALVNCNTCSRQLPLGPGWITVQPFGAPDAMTVLSLGAGVRTCTDAPRDAAQPRRREVA